MTGDTIKQQSTLEGTAKYSTAVLKATVSYSISGIVQAYDGDYIVTPKTTTQVLSTKNKRLTSDITVNSIPYFETSNEDGTTVYIGE